MARMSDVFLIRLTQQLEANGLTLSDLAVNNNIRHFTAQMAVDKHALVQVVIQTDRHGILKAMYDLYLN